MILVTGGAGYIGSHTVLELLAAGRDLLILDNFSNSSPRVLDRVARIAGIKPRLISGDIRDGALLARIFSEYPIDSVIHFAGLKAVGESTEQPISYYDNNVIGSLRLFEAMRDADVKRLIFSSSATVYGVPERMPISEGAPLSATNPYGRTKLHIEEMLRDIVRSDAAWRVVALRYFNPVGAHKSGLIGESPTGIPNNLMPYISQVAVGQRDSLGVFGNDYPTVDGTGVRDYIHVVDLARGHVAAMKLLEKEIGFAEVNLGTGQGYSVLEVLKAFETAAGKVIPFHFLPRRPGDVPECYADTRKALDCLGWQAELGLDDMCQDAWRWQQANPKGYEV